MSFLSAQGSLEYLLIIGGGVVAATLILTAVLNLADRAQDGVDQSWANGQCGVLPGNLCRGVLQVNDKAFECRWSVEDQKCFAVLLQEGPRCGDGIIEGTEACDQGNILDNDGCSSSCVIEDGWSCTGEPSLCVHTPVCGDTDGVCPLPCTNPPDVDCPVTRVCGETDGICPPECTNPPDDDCPLPQICGNGLIEGTETCDDNNTNNEDGCSSSCTTETGWNCSGEPSTCSTICGDGLIRGTEPCDGSNLNGQTCQSQGFGGGGELRCNASCSAFDTALCIPGEQPRSFSPAGDPFYRMKIETVSFSPVNNPIEVSLWTTGAKYRLVLQDPLEENKPVLHMYTRINVATNELFESESLPNLEVAKLVFDSDLGALRVSEMPSDCNAETCVIETTLATFSFNSDGLFLVKAKQPFSYSHQNLVLQDRGQGFWNKGMGLDRMWTNGYGGSLLAKGSPAGTLANSSDNSTAISLALEQEMAHMVFPSKLFDFESLYGANQRSFIWDIFTYRQLDQYGQQPGGLNAEINSRSARGFGIMVLWETLYQSRSNGDREVCGYPRHPSQQTITVENETRTVWGYPYQDVARIRALIAQAKNAGFKVLTKVDGPTFGTGCDAHIVYPDLNVPSQSVEDTAFWMRYMVQEYGIDGWLFDNGGYGPIFGGTSQNVWYKSYAFFRAARKAIGNNGKIVHHGSVDPWGVHTGLSAVMLDVYANYKYVGETSGFSGEPNFATLHGGVNDPYFRFFASGYGLSQAYGAVKFLSAGTATVLLEETARVMAQNLNGDSHENYEIFIPLFNVRKAQYLSGNFTPTVSWPVPWFKDATTVRATPNGNSVTISWETPGEPTASEVRLSSDTAWHWVPFPPYNVFGPDGVIRKDDAPNLVTQHSVTVKDLKPNTRYDFWIRSSNQQQGTAENQWFALGSFTTANQLPDSCTNTDSSLLAAYSFENGAWDSSCNGYNAFVGARGTSWQPSGGLDGSGGYVFSDNGTEHAYVGVRQDLDTFSDRRPHSSEEIAASLADPSLYRNGESTIAVWVKPTNLNKLNEVLGFGGGVIYLSAGTGWATPGGILFYGTLGNNHTWTPFYSNHSIAWNATRSDGWYHIALVLKDGIGYQFFINGVPEPFVANSDFHLYTTASPAASTNLGIYSAAEQTVENDYRGAMDNLFIYNRALSEGEICRLAQRSNCS